ncbi:MULTISPECIES: SusC/RagA family TonB-linked outer membrane protein [unclassified Proteiniphilum]|jgi:iron complex outermembrane receptor protein|uniref:SusC/RagA family TonB-linked outer membrane protein n=1 Tax=unclassified Proteiniphilum TaxID=2622718 RepID=UPI0025797321|nr:MULTISPECIES: TonB-dependent receptor [unclassified Proteiniphilum]
MYVNFKKTIKVFLTTMLSGMLMILSANAQTGATINVRGTIKDVTGEPIVGASILLQGTTSGVVTDYNGNFSIQAPGNGTLVISYVGYLTQTISINNRNIISIIMQEDTELLEEVVVIGYGTARKTDLTGSIATIAEKDFQKGMITDPASLISGKVAGVQITSNGGRAGGGATIRIRGGASLNASNDPLIVIDGMPVETGVISGSSNALSMINPNDIETMNILKDASATAIYGSRASNGVIIITTKKGRSGKVNIGINSQNSLGTVAKRIEVLTGDEFRELVTNNPYADKKYTDMLGTANTDWQKEIYRTAFTTDNNLNISGTAGKSFPYRVSVGFLSQDGTLKTDNVKRTTAGLNLNPSLLDDHLKVNLNLKGTYSHSRFADGGAIGNALRMDPTKPVTADGFNELNGYWAWMYPSGDLNTMATRNPVALLYGKDDQGDVVRSLGNIQLDYKLHFLPDLHVNVNMGYDISRGKGDVITQPWSPAFYTKGQPSGERSKYKQENRNLLFEAYLNYAKQLNFANRLELMGGYSYQDWLTTNHNYPVYYFDGTTEKTRPTFETDKPQHTLISFYARANYNLLDKYMLTATVRRDGSSRFSKDNRWGTFPSLAFAWRINEEGFLRDVDTLSNLKLRLGWGLTGQQEIGNYEYLAKYSYSENTARVQLGDKFYNMYRPDGYDSKRRWESTTTSNIGLDFGFINNRINGSIDFYNKNTKDLLNDTPLAMGGNFINSIVQNIGKMNNKGVETNINFVAVDNREIRWDLGLNFTYNKSEITQLTLNDENPDYVGAIFGDLSGGSGNQAMIHSVGYRPSMFYVYKQLYTPEGKPIDYGYADLNGDGVINDKDRYHFHSSSPDYYMGFNTSFTYKQWTAATSLRASVGNYIFNNTNFDLGTLGQVLNPNSFLMNSSTDLKNTLFHIQQMVSDYFVENASFLKMDYIQLGYDFGKIANGVGLRLNGTVQNVFTWTKYTGIDPEIQGGIDNNFYPNARTFTLGLNLNF